MVDILLKYAGEIYNLCLYISKTYQGANQSDEGNIHYFGDVWKFAYPLKKKVPYGVTDVFAMKRISRLLHHNFLSRIVNVRVLAVSHTEYRKSIYKFIVCSKVLQGFGARQLYCSVRYETARDIAIEFSHR